MFKKSPYLKEMFTINIKLSIFSIFQKTKIIKTGVFIAISLFYIQAAIGQSNGDFRSKNTGDWQTFGSWQTYNGTAWVNATTYPGQSSGTYTVTIQATHTISINSNFVSTTMGTLNVNGILNLVGGSNPRTITLNTSLLHISGATSELRFNTQKVDLYLPVNAVLRISNGGTISGACSNNTEIYIGGRLIAVCNGGGGSVATFGEIIASGGTLNARIDNPLNNSQYCINTVINLQGSYTGAIIADETVSYSGFITDPAGITTSYIDVKSIPGYILNQAGQYIFSFTVKGTFSDGTSISNTETNTVNVYSCLDIPVIASSDDAEENVSGGAVNLTSTDLELYKDGTDNQLIGIRFQNITVPKGSIITNAYIQFQVDETNSAPVSLNIVGIDVDNASQFNDTNFNISRRINGPISLGTSASVSWIPANWPTNNARGVDQRTSDLKTIVQEIINRGGWNSNNAMAFVITGTGSGTRIAESYDGDRAPELHIEFTPPPAPEINIIGNSISIVDGDITPNNLDHTYYESTAIGATITKTYTIQNTGTLPLNLTSITSSNSIEFSVNTSSTNFAIAAGSSTTFTVTYNATKEGRSTGDITILSNDSDEATYNFSVLGEISTAYNFNKNGHWKYLDNGTNQGTAWSAVGFPDTTWASADAEFGYGDGDENTIVSYGPDANNKYVTTYFRKNINISATDLLYTTLKMNAIRDDGMVVYIDGVKVWSDHMPGGVISYNTYAGSPNSGDNAIGGSDETTFITTSIPNPFTVAGLHTISVEIHQINAASTDLGFNFSLSLTNDLLNAGGLWHYLDNGSNQDATNWKTDLGLFSTWASGNAQLGFGDGDEATVVANNNQITTYFRKSITASGADVTNNTLQISAVRDDGIVIYINGVEVLRNNMPTGPINFSTKAFGDVTNTQADRNFEDFWNVFKIDNPLIAGVNQIAVEIHQYNATSNDISFNLAFETNNDFIIVPRIKPDRDGDGVEDYLDADDDNDALPDIVEGCYTSKSEVLNTGGENSILSSLPKVTTLEDGNAITYSVNNTSNFGDITSYDAGQHGFGLRVKGPATNGQLTLGFTSPVKNLFFKLIDFDEGESIKIDVYDHLGNIVNLGTSEGIYHLGSYIEYTGSNTIIDKYNAGAPNANNPENRADDIYGAGYFYFPSINVSKVVFTVNYTGGGTIRIVGVQYCSLDTDGDGVSDFYDSDSDNDGIPDIVEGGGTDTIGDGKVDNFVDLDGDGVSEPYDSNPTTYFIEEAGKLLALDFDYDGILNRVDLDSDNDGIPDIIEAGGVDANGDGKIDGFTDTIDASGFRDGYHDAFDGAGSLLKTGPDTNGDGFPNSYPFKNADGTGYPNFRDIDSDDDGIPDHTEVQGTTATFVNYAIGDSDKDGILNVFDNFVGFGGNGLIPVDSDGDGTPDYLDLDSDNDLESDLIEGHDYNGDDVINSSDLGSCLTSITAFTGKKTGFDIDEDGLDDGYDNNISQTAINYNPTNEGISPMVLPNIDDIATIERDWREPRLLYNFIDFDGFNDYIDFSDKHNLTASFTIEAWVKQDATSTGNGFIVSKTDCNKGTNLGYRFSLIANKPNIKWYNNAGGLVFDLTASHAIGKDRWYYISASYDHATTTAKIYIDGIKVAESTSVSAAPLATTESFLMGAKFDDTDLSQKLSNKFKGWIDEVRIWDVALNEEQLRMMMNQEIVQNGTAVKGKTVPIDIPGLAWTNLLGYYPMNSIVNGDLIDRSSNSKNGRIRNILTTEQQTAPLPYTSGKDGVWDLNTTWRHLDVLEANWLPTLWQVPNSFGVDGTTKIDWNIVQTSHKINTNRAVKVLGLNVNAEELSINADNRLDVTHYLKINGVLDLDGESQLIQPEGSYFDPASIGYLERDQQGEGNKYRYNDWSSPVYTANDADGKGNYTTVAAALKDGTDPNDPKNISFVGGYDGNNLVSPIAIASYWIYKYANRPDGIYSEWQPTGSTGKIYAGEGFLMKGTGAAADQNYVFVGKPNNGDITLKVAGNYDYLVGNPYASAIDAKKFLADNTPTTGTSSIKGALYFWEHYGGVNHNLKDYQAGYATLNKSGSVSATSGGVIPAGVSGLGTSTKKPGRHIAVGQGFFVVGVKSGTIHFKNSQRRFFKEREETLTEFGSVFMKTSKTTQSSKTQTQSDAYKDVRPKIRLGFNGAKVDHRQLLLTIDENATDAYDRGYDAEIYEIFSDDMYWVIGDKKYVIQGTNAIDVNKEIPLGIVSSGEKITIEIDALENMEETTDVFIKDNTTNQLVSIKNNPFEVTLAKGEYKTKYSIVFKDNTSLSVEEDILNYGIKMYMDNNNSILNINNTTNSAIEKIIIYNQLGQIIKYVNSNLSGKEMSIPIKASTGVYFAQIHTSTGKVSKKLIIN